MDGGKDGSFEYTYDAESRIVAITPAAPGSGDEKIEFSYDYLNRCVRKLVYAWDPNEGESGNWSPTADVDLRLVYHEDLLLITFDGLDSNAMVHKFVWGPGTEGKLGGPGSLPYASPSVRALHFGCWRHSRASFSLESTTSG